MRKQPNIVMVVADDTTPSYHSCYGGPTPTPHIDRLANEGVRMQRAYCNASLCCPSRWTLFTGQVTQRSRWAHQDAAIDEPAIIGQNGMLDPETPTLAKLLQDAGYFTGHIGKWHSRFHTADLGFDEPKRPLGDPDDLAVDAELRRRHGDAQEVVKICGGFEYADRVQWGNIAGKLDPKIAVHNVPWMTDGALDFLDTAAEDGRPFYLHLANSVPHSPDCQDSLNVDHRYTFAGKLEQAPRSHPSDDSVLQRMNDAGLQCKGPIAGVNAGQIMIDDQIGELIKKLEELGQLDNTIFIYNADHGVPGKGSCYHHGQHLPFVMRWPQGFSGGQIKHQLFSWTDIVPTLADACGVSFPEEHILDGNSILNHLQDDSELSRSSHYHEMGWNRSLIKGRYIYLASRYPQSQIDMILDSGHKAKAGSGSMFDNLNAPFIPDFFADDQLYDIIHDPYAQHNLIKDVTKQSVVKELSEELFAICKGMPRPFPEQQNPHVSTEEFQKIIESRRSEVDAIQHHPAGFAPRYWFENLTDPDSPACVMAKK
ncbi:MAG: sulfatase-like hydrolase/transferase [Planctomycetes bacterium]|nr:sulfatase-like hydrolase/transferase [Planctomycetota bacterium]